jgi:hypothetical protein
MVKKFHRTRRFTTTFMKTHHWDLSWTTAVHFTHSHSIPLRSILILFSHPRSVAPRVNRYACGFPTKILWAPPFSQCLPLVPFITSSLTWSPY